MAGVQDQPGAAPASGQVYESRSMRAAREPVTLSADEQQRQRQTILNEAAATLKRRQDGHLFSMSIIPSYAQQITDPKGSAHLVGSGRDSLLVSVSRRVQADSDAFDSAIWRCATAADRPTQDDFANADISRIRFEPLPVGPDKIPQMTSHNAVQTDLRALLEEQRPNRDKAFEAVKATLLRLLTPGKKETPSETAQILYQQVEAAQSAAALQAPLQTILIHTHLAKEKVSPRLHQQLKTCAVTVLKLAQTDAIHAQHRARVADIEQMRAEGHEFKDSDAPLRPTLDISHVKQRLEAVKEQVDFGQSFPAVPVKKPKKGSREPVSEADALAHDAVVMPLPWNEAVQAHYTENLEAQEDFETLKAELVKAFTVQRDRLWDEADSQKDTSATINAMSTFQKMMRHGRLATTAANAKTLDELTLMVAVQLRDPFFIAKRKKAKFWGKSATHEALLDCEKRIKSFRANHPLMDPSIAFEAVEAPVQEVPTPQETFASNFDKPMFIFDPCREASYLLDDDEEKAVELVEVPASPTPPAQPAIPMPQPHPGGQSSVIPLPPVIPFLPVPCCAGISSGASTASSMTLLSDLSQDDVTESGKSLPRSCMKGSRPVRDKVSVVWASVLEQTQEIPMSPAILKARQVAELRRADPVGCLTQ